MSTQVIARGDNDNFIRVQKQVQKELSKAFPRVPWNPFAFDFKLSKDSALTKIPRTLTVCSNRLNTDFLTDLLEAARIKYEASAYLHWYQRYGCTNETFEESFETVQKIISDYNEVGLVGFR